MTDFLLGGSPILLLIFHWAEFVSFWDTEVNPALWIISNVTVLYIFITLGLFVRLYFFRFRWRDYEGGRRIMGFTASLEGTILLIAISILTNPVGVFAYPPDILIWRPLLRVVIYFAVAYTVTLLYKQLHDRAKRHEAFNIVVDPNTAPVRPSRRERRATRDR